MTGSDPNCVTYDADGLCVGCKPNFKINFNSNLCQSIKIENYSKCGTDTTKTQFIQLDGSCNKLDINCDPSGFQPSGCFACKDGYYLYNSICYKIDTATINWGKVKLFQSHLFLYRYKLFHKFSFSLKFYF